MFNRLKCGFGLVPEFVPRFGFGPVLDFSTSQSCGRDKSVIYNSNHKPFPRMLEGEGRGDRKRSIPTVEPSEEMCDSLNAAIRKCYSELETRMSSYFPTGLKLDRYLKSRTIPLEGVHLRRKRALIGRILAEEYEDGDQDQEVQDPAREAKQ